MALKKFTNILFFLIVTLPVFGQDVFFRHFTKKDGLPHNYTFLLKENKGKLLIGTDNGMSVFDGKSFKNYGTKEGLKSPYVIGFIENYSDSLYLLTWSGGIHVFDESADSIKTYPYLQKEKAKKLHKALRIKDDIYAWQWNGGFYFNEKTRQSENLHFYVGDTTLILSTVSAPFMNHPLPEEQSVPISFSRYQNKMLVYGYKSHGIRVIEGTELKESFFHKTLGDKVISTFTKTKDGGALVGSIGEIYKVDPNGNIIYTIKIPENCYTSMMYELEDGRIAASINPSTNVQTSVIINPKDGSILNLEKLLEIKSSSAYMFVDSRERIWISTQGDGLYMIENIDINYIDINDIPTPHIQTINQLNDSSLIFSTSDKAYTKKFDCDSIKIFKGFAIRDVYSNPDDSLKLFSTYNFSFTNTDKKIPLLWAKFPGVNDGGYWVIEEDCLKVFDFKKEKIELKKMFGNFPKGVIDVPRISSAVIQKDRIWVATKGALNYYEYSENYKLTFIKTWSKDFNDWEWVQDIKLDEQSNILWIATTNGLFTLNTTDIDNGQLTKIRSLDGINCFNLTFDHMDQLWVGTSSGLFVFKNGILKRQFDESSGLLSDQITTIFESRNNIIWIGTHRGMVSMTNDKIVENIPPPIVNWTSKKYFIHSSDGAIHLPLDIGALSEMESLQLQFKISQKSDWINFNYQEKLTISNQSPGKYNIFIRGRTTGSNWSVPQKTVLVIDGYFWEYQIFKGGIIILLLISVIYYANILIKREQSKSNHLKETLRQKTIAQEKLTKVRKEIAQDFHDEMGNKLASITVLADLASMKLKDKDDDTAKILTRIESQSKQLYTGTRDFIWSIDAQNDELGVIYDYIKDFGEEFFDDLEIRYHTHKEIGENEHLLLPQSWSLQLVFIFKEAMTNIAKYAQATHVYLALMIKDDIATFSIRDNGIGIAKSKNSKNGNGMKNMQSRINKLGSATLNIESQEGEGTTIIVQFNTKFEQ